MTGLKSELDRRCGNASMDLAATVVAETSPELQLRLWHRVYSVTRELAAAAWGAGVADRVPRTGLVDVHTYATVEIDGQVVRIDVTFPLSSWDGKSDIPLACGDGVDTPAGPDVLASKAALVAAHCDPTVREPFIAALAAME